jgi:glycosyltransferase involved in cell wall biosynthesis
MDRQQPVEVELVEHTPDAPFSGIGRYTRGLYEHLSDRVHARLATQIDPPFARLLPLLHHLPLGVAAHRRGSVVHFVEDLGCSQMLWRRVRRSVATSHDLGMLTWEPEARMHRPLDRLLWYLSYMGLKRLDAVIAVSEFSRRMLIERLGISPDRVFAIHPGIDLTRFRPIDGARRLIRERYRIPGAENDRLLLYVGTEIPRKNVITLLRAMTQLPADVRLIKVGDPGAPKFRYETLRDVYRLGLGDRVTFLDHVPDDDLALLYNAADVYVCCSYLEGFGYPVVEAMACGTPVISSNAASLPEVTGNAAILVPADDSAAFGRAIERVLGDAALRARMSELGTVMSARFSWERTAAATQAVYEWLANDGPSGAGGR